MVHIPHRKCKCHSDKCKNYSSSLIKGSCTIFRKLSKTNLEQPDMCIENITQKTHLKPIKENF